VLRRVNFTVTGETNTGKTTLINALDLITPREFRKIYIEDITESINQLKYGRHQLKFRVDSGDYSNQKFSKQNQIKNLLHRTPDIIYLGEILTKDEAKAMFHCLASGLKGFQTIHANDLEALINRFLFHFKIDRSCLSDLDLLILMKNSKSQRKIVSISEVDKDNIHINEIFSYMPHLKKHKLKADLFESKIINKLSRYEDIGKESFFSVLNVYKDIFSTLKKIKKINNVELVKLFDIISYLSFKSNQNIEKFWLNWKQRNLNPLN
jgi:type II secretory ATPase GspE/PulE/Tfp pilus assembly ATPase PilB-like protein